MRVAAATLLLFAVGCKRNAPPAPAVEPAVEEQAPSAQDAASELGAARCSAAGEGSALAAGEVEIGDALVSPRGEIALGLVRRGAEGRAATVAVASPDGARVRLVDLGRPAGDAPPPRLAVDRDALFAATLVRGPAGFALELARVGERAEPAGRLAQPSDESLAYDVAAGGGGVLAAWDEDALDRARGVVKVARFGADAGGALEVSPRTSDADTPRLVRRGGGYWAAWLARRPEGEPALAPEGPAEERALRWVEAVALDEEGRPAGPARALTAATGHVTSFDLAARGDGLEVWAVDETEAASGAGGRIVRATLRQGAVEAQVVAPRGVGRAGLDLVLLEGGDLAFAAFVDGDDRTRALWPAAERPTAEPVLDGARPLVARRADVGVGALVAVVGKGGTHLRAVRCTSAPPAGRP